MPIEQRTVTEFAAVNGIVDSDLLTIVANVGTAYANNKKITATNFFGNLNVNVAGSFNLTTTANITCNNLHANNLTANVYSDANANLVVNNISANIITANTFKAYDFVIFSGNSSDGIKVDTSTPTYPWVDLLGSVHTDLENTANRPEFNIFKGNIKLYQFTLNDQVYHEFHLPHDYAPNTNVYIHVHWATNTISSAGGPTFSFEATYAKGHDQMQFSNNVTVTATGTWSNTYTHEITETQLSGISSNTSLINSADLEPDGVILVRTKLTTNTMNVDPFVFYVDLHYQSTGIGTKNKAPTFTV